MVPFSLMQSMHCLTTTGSGIPSWEPIRKTAKESGTEKIACSPKYENSTGSNFCKYPNY